MTALERQMAADAIALHAEAERRWAALRSEVKNMRDARQRVGESDDDPWTGERAFGAVDALDWTLATIGRMTGTGAESSGERETNPEAKTATAGEE